MSRQKQGAQQELLGTPLLPPFLAQHFWPIHKCDNADPEVNKSQEDWHGTLMFTAKPSLTRDMHPPLFLCRVQYPETRTQQLPSIPYLHKLHACLLLSTNAPFIHPPKSKACALSPNFSAFIMGVSLVPPHQTALSCPNPVGARRGVPLLSSGD